MEKREKRRKIALADGVAKRKTKLNIK